MKLSRKLLSVFVLVLFAFVLISCDGTATSEETTEVQTTEEPATEAPTTDNGETTTNDGGTTDGTTTEAPTTEEPAGGGASPTFSGLFTKQTYYIGSVSDYDILEGVKATDEEDGDITDNIQIVGNYTLARVGTYNVYVTVLDSDNNLTNRQVTIKVKQLEDFTIPEVLTSDDITIELWHSNGSTIENALKEYAETFTDLYPNITVNIVKNGNNYDELRTAVVNNINGGELPNIVQNYPDHVMEYIPKNAVIPLTPYIFNPTHGYDGSVDNETFTDILLTYRRENSQEIFDGEYYSLPFNKSTEVMIYNKDIIDILIAEGVIEEMPETWQGLFAIADDIRRVATQEGVIDSIVTTLNANSSETYSATDIKDDFVPIAYDSPANAFITLTRQWGGEYTSVDGDGNGIILFDNDRTRAAMSYFYDFRDIDGSPGAFTVPASLGTDYASDAFKKGQIAITFGSTGGARYNTPDYFNGEYVFDFGVAPMPYNADYPEYRTAIQQGTNMSLTTAGTDQEKLASWLFLKYLTSFEIQLDFALKTGYSPIRSSIYEDQTYINFTNGLDADGVSLLNDINTVEDAQMVMKSRAAAAAALIDPELLFVDQPYVGSSDARTAVEMAFERIILSTRTDKAAVIDEAIAEAKSNAEKVIN